MTTQITIALLLGCLASLPSCKKSSSDPVPVAGYGFLGPPPELGFQATTLRTSPAEPDRTTIDTHGTPYAPGFPYIDPGGNLYAPGQGANNLLPTLAGDNRDVLGRTMPNTLPSVPGNPYHLHDRTGEPGENGFGVVMSPIDATSPTTDLVRLVRLTRQRARDDSVIESAWIQVALNILEGVDLLTDLDGGGIQSADGVLDFLDGQGAVTRRYEGFPLVHYRNGSQSKTKTLEKVNGRWQATVHQIWFDSHIESDTAFLDVSNAVNEEWIVEYHIDVLDRGEDDFAPFVMYFNRGPDDVESAAPNNVPAERLAELPRMPHVALDTSFVQMRPGNRHRIRIKHAPGRYYNLSYHWGWRVHPPRVQATENAAKMWPGPRVTDPLTGELEVDGEGKLVVDMKTLPEWERSVFGDPDNDVGYDRRAVIDEQIGDLSPAKRMWQAFLAASTESDPLTVASLMEDAEAALWEWADRTKLPSGVTPDPESDLTLLFVNNTLYGSWRDGRELQRWFEFQTRAGHERPAAPDSLAIRQSAEIKITLLNGDRYVHGYLNVDFGGARGWENTFGPTIGTGGSGAWFTFGRTHWWINAGAGPQMDPGSGQMSAKAPIFVRPVQRDAGGNEIEPGRHQLEMRFHYDPSRRLRMYQFDPLHHDVAVFSIH